MIQLKSIFLIAKTQCLIRINKLPLFSCLLLEINSYCNRKCFFVLDTVKQAIIL